MGVLVQQASDESSTVGDPLDRGNVASLRRDEIDLGAAVIARTKTTRLSLLKWLIHFLWTLQLLSVSQNRILRHPALAASFSTGYHSRAPAPAGASRIPSGAFEIVVPQGVLRFVEIFTRCNVVYLLSSPLGVSPMVATKHQEAILQMNSIPTVLQPG